MRRRWRLLMVLALFSGLAPLMPIGVVIADDAVVATCDDASFNAALTTAQTNDGGTITFACSGTIVFDTQKTITNSNTVVIDGSGQDVILDAITSGGHFAVDSGAGLTINSLTLRNANGPTAFGGAISSSGNVEIVDSSFIDNVAWFGGAIYSDGSIMNIARSTFTGNDANRSAGAVYNAGGTVDINDSSFNGNTAANEGGAVMSVGGSVNVTGSTFTGNSANSAGGAIRATDATVTIDSSTFEGNSGSVGGVIYNDSTSTLGITGSSFSGNSSTSQGGAMFNIGTLDVATSTLHSNSSVSSGGAIANNTSSATATITNSTFTDNSSESTGGALYNVGSMSISASTISGNSSDGNGGGITVGAPVTIAASIVTGNTAPVGTNCQLGGQLNSLGSNLTDDDSCTLGAAGDIQNGNASLGSLDDNGGPVLTMVPGQGSDAIDSADCALSTPEDQRGISRPQGLSCDIGAVEVRQGGTYTLCASYYTGAVTSPLSGGCGAGQFEVVVPGDVSFCINPWTGQVQYSFGRPCTPPRFAHTMPDDGDLLTCVSYYTGANRWVLNHSQCTAYEALNTIPGAG